MNTRSVLKAIAVICGPVPVRFGLYLNLPNKRGVQTHLPVEMGEAAHR